MAIKEKNKVVQTDEISRVSRPEIDETFLFRENDTPGKVVIIHWHDTPGSVAIIRKNQGRPTSFKKAGIRLIFPGTVAGGGAEGKSKKVEKNFKKGIAFF